MSAWPFGNIPMFSQRVIHIDPAWQYVMWTPKGYDKSPQGHYDCMSLDEMKVLPVGHLAMPDSVCVMWGVFPMMPQAIELMTHYGFRYVTGGAWAKQSSTGQKWAFGTGYVLRSAAEFFIVGKMGHPQVRSKSVRNLIVSPIREHSRKPDQIYTDIEALWDGPYIDIFGRQQREGWTVWGNEANKFSPVSGGAETEEMGEINTCMPEGERGDTPSPVRGDTDKRAGIISFPCNHFTGEPT